MSERVAGSHTAAMRLGALAPPFRSASVGPASVFSVDLSPRAGRVQNSTYADQESNLGRYEGALPENSCSDRGPLVLLSWKPADVGSYFAVYEIFKDSLMRTG